MPLLPILLVLPLLLADGEAIPGLASEPTAMTPYSAVGLPAILLLVAWGGVWAFLRQLNRTRRPMWMLRADRLLSLSRMVMVLGGGALILGDGWLTWVRERTGDLVLVDEMLAITPTMLGLAGTWAVQHALEVRLRDAIRLRRLDEGRPIWPTPGRMSYVVGQFRMQLGLLGVPIVSILGLSEAARWGLTRLGDDAPTWAADAASVATAVIVFTLAPLGMRLVLPISPLPAGSVRNDLVSMCRTLGVRVGDVMLWRTHGTLVNAAVVGVLPRIRYVLLTDAIIEQVPRAALRAVIAHELAHVRHRHVPWLVATVAGLLTLAGVVSAVPAVALVARGHAADGALVGWTAGGLGLAALVGVGFVFGWVSRRYERQADTYAVQVMSREPAWATPDFSSDAGSGPAGTSAPAVASVRPPAAMAMGDRQTGPAIEEAADIAGTRGAPGTADAPGTASAAARSAAATELRVQPMAVLAMTSALGATARLNGVDPERRSWRHGSIGWRQRYLAGLVGHRADGLEIDRVVRRLKLAAALALLLGLGATAAVDAWETSVIERQRNAAPTFLRERLGPWLEMPQAPGDGDRRGDEV